MVSAENIFLPRQISQEPETHDVAHWPVATLRDQEKEMILKALRENLWIQKDAAKTLGISPRVLNSKIKKFGITHPRWRKNK